MKRCVFILTGTVARWDRGMLKSWGRQFLMFLNFAFEDIDAARFSYAKQV